MTALTIRPRTDGDRIAAERRKVATGTRTASRAIVRAVRGWPELVDELAAERRTAEDLRTVLSAIVAAEAGLAGAGAHRTSALEAAAAALKARDWPNDATLALRTDLEAPAAATN